MTDVTCPQCRATLVVEMLNASEQSACPFCGEDVADLIATTMDVSQKDSESSGTLLPYRDPPANSRIDLVEATSSRLVLSIAPGGQTSRSIGCFALFWNGFLLIFSPLWGGGMVQGGGWAAWLGVIAFLSIFWIIGLVMVSFWMHLRFTRTHLLVEQQRIAVQKIFFKRKKTKQVMLKEDSRAELVESYQQNDEPVYRIEVSGSAGKVKFGTALSEEEKNWLVDVINEFLGFREPSAERAATYPEICPACGEKLETLSVDVKSNEASCPHCAAVLTRQRRDAPTATALVPVEPEQLSPDIRVIVHEDHAAQLRFSLPVLAPHPALAWGIGVFSLIGLFVLTIWTVVAVKVIGGPQANPAGLMLLIIFLLVIGLPVVFTILSLKRGRIYVDIRKNQTVVEWKLVPFRLKKKFATHLITEVSLGSAFNVHEKNPRVRSSNQKSKSSGNSVGRTALVSLQSQSKRIPLTINHPVEQARQVAGLMLYQLERMGVNLQQNSGSLDHSIGSPAP